MKVMMKKVEAKMDSKWTVNDNDAASVGGEDDDGVSFAFVTGVMTMLQEA